MKYFADTQADNSKRFMNRIETARANDDPSFPTSMIEVDSEDEGWEKMSTDSSLEMPPSEQVTKRRPENRKVQEMVLSHLIYSLSRSSPRSIFDKLRCETF